MRKAAVIGLVCAALAATAACSGSSSSKSSAGHAAPAGPGIAANPSSAAAGRADGKSSSPAALDLMKLKAAASPDLIRTGTVSIEAKDVDVALQRATAIVQGAGGHVFASNASFADDPSRHIHAEFKVPPAAFDDVMKRLGTVGKVTATQTATDDVTGQVVDLDARLAAARTSAQRLRDLLAHSANVADLLQVENTLAQRESEVESLAAQAAALHAQVAEGTIKVEFVPTVAPAAAAPSHHIPGFLTGLRTGAAAFVNALLVLSTVLGFALPFVVPLAAIALLARRFLRRRRAATLAG